MKAFLRPAAAALLVAFAPVAGTVFAPAAHAAQPAIAGISINSDAGVTPGATLRVQLGAPANATRVNVTLGDSGIVVPLKQQSAGTYIGSYVVRRSDRIDPSQLMTARAVVDDRTLTRQFRYPPSFVALSNGGPPPQAPMVAQAPGPRMDIERFFIRSSGPIEPGRELRFRLIGAPGGDASMQIPGVIQGLDLRETRPGEYEGTYTVTRRDDPGAFRSAVATLRRGDDRVTARLQFNQPPQITDLLPANGDRVAARGRTHIAARISDESGGVDPSRVRLRLNGQDVTADARISPDEVHFRADLDPGRYAVELTARDDSGNMTTKTWTFDVVPERHGMGAGPAPYPFDERAPR